MSDSLGFEQTARLFDAELQRRRLPLCPEISLWLLGDEVDLNRRVNELFSIASAPYWAFCWGSGQALARYVLDHPELVRGKVVADFGAGSGVAAIAACKAGAARVYAVDIDDHALHACAENARLNGVTLVCRRELPENYEVLLASDVLYEVGNHTLLRTAIARGCTVLVSDPLRPGNARMELMEQARYQVKTLPDVDAPCTSAVLYHLSEGSPI